jgi:hypothetical protein
MKQVIKKNTNHGQVIGKQYQTIMTAEAVFAFFFCLGFLKKHQLTMTLSVR